MAPRFSHNSTEATGAPSHQGDAKTRAAAEEFNRGEMEKHCGRFSRDQSFMDEQMKAFAAAREEKYRGTGQGSPFVEKFASMYPAPTKERIKQREAAHEAFHASRVVVPSDGKTPGQAQAASNAAPSFPGRGWFTHSARHGGHRGRYRHAHYQD
ncbi:unnamed protein product [Phytophthora lilii]|uniref:Unnamed protein product n=1 Tax=Phytophthora lilii TaxID=2077276 RepID=A0A9W6TS90_9STRA|nr:unnamed protein product [Phytophthora lilii]